MSKHDSYAANKKISQLLMRERKAKGLTQAEVAARLKKPQSFVSKYESGQRKLAAVELIAVCKALGLKPADFFKVYERG